VSAGCVFVGMHWLSLTISGMAMLNVGLVAGWFGLAVLIRRRYRLLTAEA
jgi:hypothetical protein